MKASIRLLALSALIAASPLALAGTSPEDVRSEVVKYNDLNIHTPAGAATLYTRLKVASRKVCRDVVTTTGLPGMIERGRCAGTLLDSAVAQAGLPTLTALHQGRAADLTASR
jgi:UrcA family protein